MRQAAANNNNVRQRGTKGPPRKYATLPEIHAYVKQKSIDPTWTMGPEDLLAFGLAADAPMSTKRMYYAHVSAAPFMREQTATGTQTAVRWTATHSERAAVSLMLFLALGLFLVGERFRGAGLLECDHDLAQLVSHANGGAPVFVRPLSTMFNSDATNVYIYSGALDENEQSTAGWCRLGASNRDTRGRASKKNGVGKNLLNLAGIRISVSCLGSAAGSIAPVAITVSGLSETQLKVPMKRWMLESGDYLVFLRAKGDSEFTAGRAHWQAIDHELMTPWILKEVGLAGYPEGHPARGAFQTFDGCGVELGAFTETAMLDYKQGQNMLCGKGHRSRTEGEQAWDSASPFKTMHAGESRRTIETDNERLAAKSVAAVLAADPDVEMGLKAGPIAEFCGTMPRWRQIHLQGSKLFRGFQVSGWAVSLDQPYPTVASTLGTSKVPVSKSTVSAVTDPDTFSKLYWGCINTGSMVETHCDELGIPLDTKPDGTPHVRDEDALPLSNKRHALLSNGAMARHAREAVAKAAQTARIAHATETTLVERKLLEAAQCASQVEALSGTSLADSRVEHFDTKGNAQLLKSFFHCRKRPTSAVKGLQFPNRGKANSATPTDAAVERLLAAGLACEEHLRAEGFMHVADATLAAFGGAKAADLRGFHASRTCTVPPPKGTPVLKKGTLAAASKNPPDENLIWACHRARNNTVVLAEPVATTTNPPPPPLDEPDDTGGTKNLMQVCWGCRNDPVIMAVPAPFVPPALPKSAAGDVPAATLISVGEKRDAPGPHIQLDSPQATAWISTVKGALRGMVGNDTPVTARANRAHEFLLARLPGHVSARVRAAAKRDLGYFVWRWAYLNFGRACAVLECTTVLYPDYETLGWDSGAIASNAGAMELVHALEDSSIIGAYAAKHTPTGRIVRVGMAGALGDTPMVSRWQQHTKCAQQHGSDVIHSNFYKLFPSRTAVNPTKPPIRIGWFEQVEPLVFFGMEATGASPFIARTGADAILEWPQWFMDELGRTMSGLPNIEAKQRRAVCYLFELTGDLLVAPRDNVSEAPGMEQLLRQYGSGE